MRCNRYATEHFNVSLQASYRASPHFAADTVQCSSMLCLGYVTISKHPTLCFRYATEHFDAPPQTSRIASQCSAASALQSISMFRIRLATNNLYVLLQMHCIASQRFASDALQSISVFRFRWITKLLKLKHFGVLPQIMLPDFWYLVKPNVKES